MLRSDITAISSPSRSAICMAASIAIFASSLYMLDSAAYDNKAPSTSMNVAIENTALAIAAMPVAPSVVVFSCGGRGRGRGRGRGWCLCGYLFGRNLSDRPDVISFVLIALIMNVRGLAVVDTVEHADFVLPLHSFGDLFRLETLLDKREQKHPFVLCPSFHVTTPHS